jgi:pyruvate formate lyase activating enzyme
MTVKEVVGTAIQDRIFYEPEGGVTFSGGEPLLQPEFLIQALTACRADGLHTAVDTCGFARTEQLLAVADVTDLFLFDLKFIDEEKHRRHTGVSNGLILENLRRLSLAHNRIWIRVPIIPGLNDDDGELEAIARFTAGLPNVRQVNLLPYHRTGAAKAARLGRPTLPNEVAPPAKERMDRALELFQTMGLAAKAGG